jgi:hypothetical protein
MKKVRRNNEKHFAAASFTRRFLRRFYSRAGCGTNSN